MNSKYKGIFLGLALATVGMALWSFSRTGLANPKKPVASSPMAASTLPEGSQDLVAEELARQARRRQQAFLVGTMTDYAANGVSIGSASFHLLRPQADPRLREGIWDDDPYASDWFHFWPVDPRYELPYQAPWGDLLPPSQAQIGLGELFSTRLVKTADAVSDGAGLYNVEITFGPAAVQLLTTLLDPKEGYEQLDWYGLYSATGESTEMEAVVVADNFAYTPFSVTDIVNQNLVDTGIVVASELGFAEASELANRIK